MVIPCFNDGATVREAVDSARDEPRVGEVMVVDDGSTDPGTLAVCKALEAEGVGMVRRPNGGLGAARNTGVAATSAPYVLCLDADDRLLPGAAAQLANVLDRERDLGLVWGDYRLFGDVCYRQETAPVLDPWHISHQNDLPACALIRRDVLERSGGWELRGGYEDWDLWMTLAELGVRGRRVPVEVYEYRIHGTRMLRDAAARHAERMALLRERHPELFAGRRRAWRASAAPWPLRLALPVIATLPLGAARRRQLAGAACHLAHRRGAALLLRRGRGR